MRGEPEWFPYWRRTQEILICILSNLFRSSFQKGKAVLPPKVNHLAVLGSLPLLRLNIFHPSSSTNPSARESSVLQWKSLLLTPNPQWALGSLAALQAPNSNNPHCCLPPRVTSCSSLTTGARRPSTRLVLIYSSKATQSTRCQSQRPRAQGLSTYSHWPVCGIWYDRPSPHVYFLLSFAYCWHLFRETCFPPLSDSSDLGIFQDLLWSFHFLSLFVSLGDLSPGT